MTTTFVCLSLRASIESSFYRRYRNCDHGQLVLLIYADGYQLRMSCRGWSRAATDSPLRERTTIKCPVTGPRRPFAPTTHRGRNPTKPECFLVSESLHAKTTPYRSRRPSLAKPSGQRCVKRIRKPFRYRSQHSGSAGAPTPTSHVARLPDSISSPATGCALDVFASIHFLPPSAGIGLTHAPAFRTAASVGIAGIYFG